MTDEEENDAGEEEDEFEEEYLEFEEEDEAKESSYSPSVTDKSSRKDGNQNFAYYQYKI